MKLYCLMTILLVLGYGNRETVPIAIGMKRETGNRQLVTANLLPTTGADQTDKYIHLLQNKRVGILANPTTIIGKKHLVDSLMNRGIKFVKAFGPEHGFRGKASAGAKVSDETDAATGIPIISLYGSKRKPTEADLADVDIMVFD